MVELYPRPGGDVNSRENRARRSNWHDTMGRIPSHAPSGTCRKDGRAPGKGPSAPDVEGDKLPPWQEKCLEFLDFPQKGWTWLMDHPGWAFAGLAGMCILAIS